MSATECQTEAPKLEWSPKIYVGDSESQTYIRQNEDGGIEQISCSDKDFDQRIILSNKEIAAFQAAYNRVINSCAQWKQ